MVEKEDERELQLIQVLLTASKNYTWFFRSILDMSIDFSLFPLPLLSLWMSSSSCVTTQRPNVVSSQFERKARRSSRVTHTKRIYWLYCLSLPSIHQKSFLSSLSLFQLTSLPTPLT